MGNVIEFYDNKRFLDKFSKHFNVDKKMFEEIERNNRIKHDLGKITTRQFIQNLNKGLGKRFTSKEYYALRDKFKIMRWNKELLTMIKRLRKNYDIYLLTNNSQPEHQRIIKEGYHKYFDKMLFSYTVGVKKPKKKFFEILLKRTGHSFKECILVDDRKDICHAVRGYGMQSIIYTNNTQLKKELQKKSILLK